MLSKSLIFVLIVAGAAAAQTPAKAVAAQAVGAQKALAYAPANPLTPSPSPSVVQKSAPAAKAAARPAPEPAKKLVGKRDPFQAIIQQRATTPLNCKSGKGCLVVGEMVLKGIVKGPAGMLAVVENQQRKAYFLRETDPVFNGRVVRITADSVVFREKVMDRAGREMTREVVKRVPGNTPAA